MRKTVAHIETFLKGLVFDCQSCGQCVLSQTGLICPMTCPKGLRNGPCGGTLHGECEVYPDRRCVWVRIGHRTAGDSLQTPPLLPSPDARLFNTSSYLNMLSGSDRGGRTPLPYLDLGDQRTRQPVTTLSRLEQRLKSGAFVKTCEIRAPRTAQWDRFVSQALLVRDHFDAVNATAYLNARPSISSPMAAAKLRAMGIDSICQSTCRDHTRTTFIAELLQNQINQVHNVMCLTGDSYSGLPKIKQVFDMDAALMIYEARHLRHTGIIRFTGEAMHPAPRPFLGAAINPYTQPIDLPIRRLKQKIAAGVDFIQTQLVFDVPRFRQFMDLFRQEKLDENVFLIVGVPVVTSAKVLDMLPKIPGAYLPPEMIQHLKEAPNMVAAGLAVARKIIEEVHDLPGVAGVHLMLFGPDHAVLSGLVRDLPVRRCDWMPDQPAKLLAELAAKNNGSTAPLSLRATCPSTT